MKSLSVVGTAAMFLVGGGILVHGWPWLHHIVEGLVAASGDSWLTAVVSPFLGGLAGLATGALVLGVVTAGQAVLARKRAG